MVERRLIKHLVKMTETYSNEELNARRSLILEHIERTTDRDHRRDLKLRNL